MKDILSLLHSLRRPRLLIRAARAGVVEYQRDTHLKRHLGYGPVPRSGAALMRLMEIEEELDRQRRSDDAGYSLIRHVDVLIALMGEARILQASHPQ